ncbi:hypothetical protein RJ639_031686, partial [Escallonia herrerae]
WIIWTSFPLDLLKMDFLLSIFTFLATALLLIIVAFSALMLRIYTGKSIKDPKYAPVAGTVFDQIFYFNRLYDYLAEIGKRHHTFRLLAPEQSELYTTETRNIEHILKTNFENYSKGQYNQDIVTDLFGEGIFVVDGVKWRQQRKLASFEFSTRVLRDFSCTVFRKNAGKLARTISEFSAANRVFDIQDLLMKCTLDSIFKVGFGVDMNCLEGSSKEGSAFIKAFDDSNALIYWRYVDPFWKLKRSLNIGCEASLKKNIKVIYDFVHELIRKKRVQQEMQQNCVSANDDKDDILSRFLVESKKDPEEMNDRYLRDIILNFMIAGKDTTANTLSWFFYMLSKNPLMQEKVAQEVEEVIGSHGSEASADDFVTKITDEALETMHYLHATLTETLRLYPAVPIDGRCAESDDTLPDGFKLKKGDGVYYMSYAMGRMTCIWGEDAEEFRPERWLKDGIFQPESPFKFIAFHAGPRICLGRDFAYRQMKIVSITLLHFFRFKLANDTKRVTYRTMFTLHIDGGLHLRAVQRQVKLHHYMTDLAGKYKTYRLISPFWSEIYTSDLANVEYILKTNFDNYGKGWYNYTILKDLLGDGIFAVDGEKWRQQRKVSSHEFSTKVLRDFSSTVFRRNAAKLATIDLFMKSTLDSIFKITFGVELDSICGSTEEGKKLSNAFDDSSAMTVCRYVDIFWKIKKFLNIGSEDKLRKNIKVVDDFVYKLIQSKQEKICKSKVDIDIQEDILSRFLLVSDTDPKYLRYIILNFIVAGKDTSAAVLSWFIYMLCKHPAMQERIAQEIKEATDMKEIKDYAVFAGGISEEALEKMQYLHAALTEALRLYPTVPVGWHNYSILSDLLGDGIFTVDGDKWLQQRKVSSYEFSTKALRDFSSVIFKKNVAKLANVLSEAATSNQIVDIQDLFMKSTLDSISKVAFGVELDSMCGSKEEGIKFSNAFDDSSALTLRRYVDMTWKIKKALNIGSEAELKKNIKVINEFVYKLICGKTEQMHVSQDESFFRKDDILSRFLQLSDTDPKYLRDIILNFIIAGKDTTATTLSWFIYMLCKHPEVQENVAQEIKEATSKKVFANIPEFVASLNEEALERMEYLHAVLTETLRLSDSILQFWWPERWFDENGSFQQESPFKFTAFQAGPRICLGREFAYRQMKIFSAVLIACFKFKLSDDKKAVNYRTMINLHIDGGLQIRAFHRLKH